MIQMQSPNQLPPLAKIPALLLIITGGLFAFYFLFFNPVPYQAIQAGYFLDRIPIPLDLAHLGPLEFPIRVDNFLVFQEFKSLAPGFTIPESLFFGILVWLVGAATLSLVSEFKKGYFILAGIIWILLLTLSNLNGLNIGGPSSNFALIIALSGSLLPVIYFHIRAGVYSYPFRFLSNLLISGAAFYALIHYAEIPSPALFLAEHLSLIGFGMAICWIFWSGHGLISGIFVLLTRANRNLNLRISIQISLITLVYLLILLNSLFDLVSTPLEFLPVFNPLLLLLPIGILGWFTLEAKTNSVPSNLVTGPMALKVLYLLGFGISLWMVWKLKLSGNQAGEELFKHLLVYTQLGFSLFFLIYLLMNFATLMDSGQAVDRILFKPYNLPYYHQRIGGLIAMLVMIAYSEGIIGVQVNSYSNNILGDYYYQSDQKLEASIIYENSWFRYRNNPKAKNLTAHLLIQLNQPSLAKQHLEQSFAEAPQVDNILLLGDRLLLENNIFESIYYLEQGLKWFPGDPRLLSNLALCYVRTNRFEDALSLLEEKSGNEALQSNLSALQAKLGVLENNSYSPEDLIGQINEVAKQNALGNLPEKDLLEAIQEKLEKESSPKVIQAAWRNVLSQKDFSDPNQDLELLERLWQEPGFEQFIMDLQETAVIRSLGAGRISDAIKNLNGLAFRNPGDAARFLSLSSSILAQQMDFEKASLELMGAEENGFQNFQAQHLVWLYLGGKIEKAVELSLQSGVPLPSFLLEESGNNFRYLQLIASFHESIPDRLFKAWGEFPSGELKTDLAIRILTYKAHGLDESDLRELGKEVMDQKGSQADLGKFLSNPDLKNQASVEAFLKWQGLGEELTGNPYIGPLIWSAVEINPDKLKQYEILNAATEFNRDPVLWIKKIKLAREIGLSNYATEALVQMQEWLSDEEIQSLQLSNF
ncbi:tetratricopeptide repeat protein [Algoriphagus sp. CAU 1675]|uniref:tetratricopeptide repeat protein n=1 Tax=Algoriphagus sp. CAU 1675 TaxID=3032597 RepID=UPI0023DBDD3F|nr:tetratricopeptide repeat protein [Algoriphagus sp. CAU 1675]MDF2159362.1 tetratricopeptide repeat protein [Algoriphagus sp. CAU 1675]